MRILKLTTYLKQANKEYKKIKQAIGEEKMKKYRIDYDYILFNLLRKEERPFMLVWKSRTYEIWTEENLERALLKISY